MVFSSKTETNGKIQILSSIELIGLKLYGSNCILTHKNEIHKKLNNYWINKKQFEKLKSIIHIETSDF